MSSCFSPSLHFSHTLGLNERVEPGELLSWTEHSTTCCTALHCTHFPSVSLRFLHSRCPQTHPISLQCTVKQHEQQEHGSPAGQGSCELLVLSRLVKLRRWGGGIRVPKAACSSTLTAWVTMQTKAERQHPHMKCICSHYSGVSAAAANTRGLTLAFVGGMCMC